MKMSRADQRELDHSSNNHQANPRRFARVLVPPNVKAVGAQELVENNPVVSWAFGSAGKQSLTGLSKKLEPEIHQIQSGR